MKTALITLPLLVICTLLCFLAPHHRRKPSSFQSCTLGEIYGEVFRTLPEINSPRQISFLMIAALGMASTWYPVLFVLLVRWVSPQVGQSGGPWLVLGGLLAAVGAIANFIGMIASHITFGWGGGGSSHDETHFLWMIPVFQLTFAVASIAAGFSATIAGWFRHLLEP